MELEYIRIEEGEEFLESGLVFESCAQPIKTRESLGNLCVCIN